MTRDATGDLIEIKRQLRSALDRIAVLERHFQLITGWMDATGLRLDMVERRAERALDEVVGVCDQVERLCEAISDEDLCDGETVN